MKIGKKEEILSKVIWMENISMTEVDAVIHFLLQRKEKR